LVPVKSKEFTFELDLAAIAAAINEKTRGVIINSPNNPTGQIYSAADIAGLSEILTAAMKKYGHPIYLIADEPYRFLNFDQVEIPSVLAHYEFSVVIGSYSKSLSLAGERIGYIAVNPAMQDGEKLVAGLIMTTRILGFV
ncbi:MAG: aminotransferase class I/II-fold pyridoxal phosphate-dependent enzyme, partial [Victivallaceae bacterium]